DGTEIGPARLSSLRVMLRHLSSLARNRRQLWGETAWVVGHKASELAVNFLTLKVLTTLMRNTPSVYGEYNLVLTATLLLGGVSLTPVNQAYLRYYHTASAQGVARPAGIAVLRWYVAFTGGVALLCLFLNNKVARAFSLEPWTPLAAGLVFLTSRWRSLGVDILEVSRARREWTLYNVGFLVLQLIVVGLLTHF